MYTVYFYIYIASDVLDCSLQFDNSFIYLCFPLTMTVSYASATLLIFLLQIYKFKVGFSNCNLQNSNFKLLFTANLKIVYTLRYTQHVYGLEFV